MRIVTDPSVLSQISKECKEFTSPEISIALLEMQMHINKGVGLAAIQVGHPIRIIMLNTDDVKITLLDPVITKVGKATRTSHEGCLSIPGKQVAKARHFCIILTGFTEMGQPYKRKLKGFDAFVAQHEVDHLNGITI